MPLDTYADLIGTVADYLERADLGPHIPTFVALAEKRLHRRLNLADNEVLARLDLVAGRAPLPDDYAAWRTLSDGRGLELEFLPPHAFVALYGRSYGLTASGQGDGYDDVADGLDRGGRARAFTILGSIPLDDIDADVSIWPAGLNNPFLLTGPAGTGQVSLVYRQGLPPLTEQTPKNWCLVRHPDLYIYATLVEAEPFLKNDGRIATWKGLLDEAIGDLTALDRAARWGRARIRTFEATP